MNSGDNGNHWIAVNTVGTAGITGGSSTNRDGIGAVAFVTPEWGNTVMRPVHVGNYTSAHAREGNFGLGASDVATVEMQWQGGVRNKLYGVWHGERVDFPEIPCSYDGNFPWPGQYLWCVHSSLEDIEQAGIISHIERVRLFVSAIFARIEHLSS